MRNVLAVLLVVAAMSVKAQPVEFKGVPMGASVDEVRKALTVAPHGCLFRFADLLLSHQPTVNAARLEYLLLKRLYLQTHH